MYCFRDADHTKKVCEKYTSKSKMPFPFSMAYRQPLLVFTLDFNLPMKNYCECSFVNSECSLQSSNVCFEVRSDNLR